MWDALWIIVGGGGGSLDRRGASGLAGTRFGERFPWGVAWLCHVPAPGLISLKGASYAPAS